MSEKKSPPHKEKACVNKAPMGESKTNKRKLTGPSSPYEDDEKKNQQKRKRVNLPEGSSPEHIGMGSPRGAGTVSRLNVPLSERQQMALLMRMTDESTVGDASPKSPSSGNQVTSTKRTPADKKVNKRNERGEAPLHMAAKRGDYKQTKRLLKAGASVNMKDYAGWTALHEACNSGNVKVAKCLLKAGADVNVQGFDDDTPLHDASSNGHRKLVQLLLHHGAKPLQANLKGKSALNVAATSQIEAILHDNNVTYSSDSDSNSDSTSSDSVLSSKDEERTLDEDFKLHGGQGKPDAVGSSSASIPSSRRQSVPASPDKMAASPRLFMKFQHKKPSSTLSSTAEAQQRVSEWNVLIDTSCEVTSEGESGAHPVDRVSVSAPASSSSSSTSLSSSNRLLRQEESNWSRGQGAPPNSRPPIGRAGIELDGCPDSTVSASVPHGHHPPAPLERTATEPFTPRGLGPLENNDIDEGDVFPVPNSSSTIGNANNNNSNTFSSSGSSTPFCSSSSTSAEHNKHLVSLTSSSSSSSLSSSSTQQHHPHHPLYHSHSSQQQQQQSTTSSVAATGVSGGGSSSSNNIVYPPAGRHALSQRLPNMVQVPPSNNSINPGLESSSSGVSSSSSPSLSHRTSSAACQFSMISSSSTTAPMSTAPSSLTSSSSSASISIASHQYQQSSSSLSVAPSSLPTPSSTPTSSLLDSSSNRSTLSFTTYASRAKAGGSIVTGLSDRALAATSVGVASSHNLSIAPSPAQCAGAPPQLSQSGTSPRRDSLTSGRLLVPPRVDEISLAQAKSDTSSCDSPLRVDMDDSNPTPSEQGSRPSTPRVPPLKIIMPTKASVPSSDHDAVPQVKPALPYVLNPTQEGEGWTETEDGQVVKPPNVSVLSVLGLESEEAGGGGTGMSSASPGPLGAGGGANITPSAYPNPAEGAGAKELVARNLDLDESESRESDSRNEQGDNSGDKSDEGKEKRPTRTLRSHTAMLQQQQQTNKTTEKNGVDSKDDGDNSSTTRSQKGDDSAADDSSFPPRKRKLRNKTEQQTHQVTTTTVTATKLNVPLEKPPNPYEIYLNLRRQIATRHRSLCSVQPKPPSGYKDYLMVNCTYVLQGNATSTLSVPMLPPPNMVTEPMKEFFNQQEKERYRLRLQHVIEREKLMLSIEQEILREHGRAARAMANQTLPLSVCTILREEEIYNQQEMKEAEDRDKNVRSRYNGRQFLSWLKDVDDKYERIKRVLLIRHHHEADTLYAVQKLDWEWKMKECGLCDHKNTPVIDELHVPMVTVSDDFHLLPFS